MKFLEIKVMKMGKNSSLIISNLSTGNAEIHLSNPLPEIVFSEATKRHDHHTKQLLVTDCNENDDIDGWSLMII